MHDWGMLIDPGDPMDDWLAKIAEASQESGTAVTGTEGRTARLVAEAMPVFTAPVGIDAGVFVGCRNTRFTLVRHFGYARITPRPSLLEDRRMHAIRPTPASFPFLHYSHRFGAQLARLRMPLRGRAPAAAC